MITVHACYIYAALTLLLPLKTIHLFWVKIKVVEEFISKEMSFLANEWILFKLEIQFASVHRWPYLYEQLVQQIFWKTIN